jgi:beta-mannosidase
LAPLALSISDEGVNGLRLHLANDRATRVGGTLRVTLFRAGEIAVGSASAVVDAPGHSAQELSIDAMFEGFRDLSHAYRFGAPAQDLVVATLEDADATVLARTHFVLGGPPAARELDVGLRATVSRDAEDRWVLEVGARRFAYAVRSDIAGFEADDEYFSLAPGETRRIQLRALGAADATPRGKVHALNAEVAAKVTGA